MFVLGVHSFVLFYSFPLFPLIFSVFLLFVYQFGCSVFVLEADVVSRRILLSCALAKSLLAYPTGSELIEWAEQHRADIQEWERLNRTAPNNEQDETHVFAHVINSDYSDIDATTR